MFFFLIIHLCFQIIYFFYFPSGGLANYTPSKVNIEASFELGVSRVVIDQHAAPGGGGGVGGRNADVGDDYLKPAEESTTWSAETTADLLF